MCCSEVTSSWSRTTPSFSRSPTCSSTGTPRRIDPIPPSGSPPVVVSAWSATRRRSPAGTTAKAEAERSRHLVVSVCRSSVRGPAPGRHGRAARSRPSRKHVAGPGRSACKTLCAAVAVLEQPDRLVHRPDGVDHGEDVVDRSHGLARPQRISSGWMSDGRMSSSSHSPARPTADVAPPPRTPRGRLSAVTQSGHGPFVAAMPPHVAEAAMRFEGGRGTAGYAPPPSPSTPTAMARLSRSSRSSINAAVVTSESGRAAIPPRRNASPEPGSRRRGHRALLGKGVPEDAVRELLGGGRARLRR